MSSPLISEHQAAWLVWLLAETERAEAKGWPHPHNKMWGVWLGRFKRASRSAVASRSRALSNLERRGYLVRWSGSTGEDREAARLNGWTTGRHVRATNIALTEDGRAVALRLRAASVIAPDRLTPGRILSVNRLALPVRSVEPAAEALTRDTIPAVNGLGGGAS